MNYKNYHTGNRKKVTDYLEMKSDTWVSIRDIARELGLHYVSVWRVLIWLESENLLESRQEGFRYRQFRLKK